MQLNRENNKKYVGLFFAGFLIFFLIAYFADLHNKIIHVSHEQQQIYRVKNDIRIDQQLLTLKDQMKGESNRLNKYNKPLLSGDNLTSLLYKIFYLAKLTNCCVKLIDPRESEKNINLVELILEGQLTQLNAFIGMIEQQQLLLNFTRIKLHHKADGLWGMNVSFEAFLAKKNKTPLFSSNPVKIDNQMLTLFPVEQIHYAGQINDDHIQWVLIKLPNAKTMPVRLGDILGVEKLHISIINSQDQKIILENKQEITK